MKTSTQKIEKLELDSDVTLEATVADSKLLKNGKKNFSVASIDLNITEVTESKENPRKTNKAIVTAIKLGQKFKVDSKSSGTLILNSGYVKALKLQKGDKVTVDGKDRTISAVALFEKKERAQIATAGCGKWPVGTIEISFNRI